MLLLVGGTVSMAGSPTLEWSKLFGTRFNDESHGVSSDGLGNVYVSGYGGYTREALSDAFVSKYDSSGTLLWTQELASSERDNSLGVSADGLGNVFVSGFTNGSLDGASAGSADAFLSKYDTNGHHLWTHQLGTDSYEQSHGVSADHDGNVYISGYTAGGFDQPGAGGRDAFVSKFDGDGILQWTRQFGTSTLDQSYGVSVDGLGGVYISGYTFGTLGDSSAGDGDAFVTKLDETGEHIWTRQFGTNELDRSYAVSADNWGNVFISGYTMGDLAEANAGEGDAFVSKFDTTGTHVWTRQLGTDGFDVSLGVTTDRLGNVFISGSTGGSLDGINAGSRDAFVSKYNSIGDHLWTEQLGTTGYDESHGVAVDEFGGVYISGWTVVVPHDPNGSWRDAFVAKFHDTVPEPNTFALLITGALVAASRQHRKPRP